VWTGNARNYAALTLDHCRELIDSIIAEGGQKVPALVRKLKNDPSFDYEIIYGTRRHWSITWLRANNYPDFTFLAEVRDIDDEAAFRVADLENRSRKDITVIERAKNYAAALEQHYEGRQDRMAERLKISKPLLSKMVAFAKVSDNILSAFHKPEEVSLRQGYALAQATSVESAERRVSLAASTIVKQNAEALEAGQGPMPTAAIFSRLFAAASETPAAEKPTRQILYQGKPLITVLYQGKKGMQIKVHSGTGANLEAIVQNFRETLETTDLAGGEHE